MARSVRYRNGLPPVISCQDVVDYHKALRKNVLIFCKDNNIGSGSPGPFYFILELGQAFCSSAAVATDVHIAVRPTLLVSSVAVFARDL